MVNLKNPDMKNNLLALKSNIDAQLPTHNDFLQLVITSKMEGEFVDILEEVKDILERDYFYEEEDDDDIAEETDSFYIDKLKDDPPPETTLDFNSNSFLYAGYSDCMEEAIRFLVEEENISPDHSIVKNLKAHLEKSKDRILQTYTIREENAHVWKNSVDNVRDEISDMFLETFQNCRDSG